MFQFKCNNHSQLGTDLIFTYKDFHASEKGYSRPQTQSESIVQKKFFSKWFENFVLSLFKMLDFYDK